MTTSIPSTLRLRLLSVHPRLLLAEIQLVDTTLLYRRVDGRDHVPTEVRAVRPTSADWARLRLVLDEVSFCSWPRRWPHVHREYAGDFAIGVEWDGRAAMSAGPIGVAPAVDRVLDEIQRLAGIKIAVATARRAGLDRHCPPRSLSAGEAVATPQEGAVAIYPTASRPLALTQPSIR